MSTTLSISTRVGCILNVNDAFLLYTLGDILSVVICYVVFNMSWPCLTYICRFSFSLDGTKPFEACYFGIRISFLDHKC